MQVSHLIRNQWLSITDVATGIPCTIGPYLRVLSYNANNICKFQYFLVDRIRTSSRCSKLNSRTLLIGEQPNPWERLHPQVKDESTSRCQTALSICTIKRDKPVIPRVALIRWAEGLSQTTFRITMTDKVLFFTKGPSSLLELSLLQSR